jgi:hypothetical protein
VTRAVSPIGDNVSRRKNTGLLAGDKMCASADAGAALLRRRRPPAGRPMVDGDG